jgi:hypothetical protein
MTEDNKDNQGISDTPPDPRAVDISSVTIHMTETRPTRHGPRTIWQSLFHYFKYFLSWLWKLGFRTVLINLLIIGFCWYIFWESGKDSLLIEPFEVPEQLAKEGYNGRVIANKLMDQMNYIKEHSEIDHVLTPFFFSQSDEEKKRDGKRVIDNI